MKKLSIFLLAAFSLVASCQKFDDTPIWDKLNDHEDRISTLEALCRQMNTNITSLQSLVEALQKNDCVTAVVPVTEAGVEIGYTITFASGKYITIYHGKNGNPGQNGTDGKDGYTPVISIAKDTDGVYYWMVDGKWLTDASGNKIPTTGKDGADGTHGKDGENGQDGSNGNDGQPGEDGVDGKDGITPQLKIEDGMWYVSYDNCNTWELLGQATGDQGPQGPQGNPGVGGDSMFSNVDYSSSTEYVVFVLSTGVEIKIPTWYAFQTLKEQCNQMNSNIVALQTIVSALQDNDYISSITPIYENAKEIGYIINFTKSGKVTIYHGQDGQNGTNGTNGTNGVDGHSPVIGVKADTDGVYYWTLDGAWVLDASGNKVPTTGKDGQNGSTGATGSTGADGITPQLKIENGYWHISYDNGTSWQQLGQATGDQGIQGETGATGPQGPQGTPGTDGKNGDSFFQSVTETDKYVSMILADGTEIKVPKYPVVAAELTLGKVTGFTATYNGVVFRECLDLKVTVYYSTMSNLTVYKNSGSVSVTEFNDEAFTVKLINLKEKTKYYYFTEIVCDGKTTFSEVMSFETGEADSYVDWEEGEKVEDEI